MHVALVVPRGFYDSEMRTEFDSAVYYYGLAKALVKNGIQVTILCEDGRRDEGHTLLNGLQVVSFRKSKDRLQYAFNVHHWLLDNPGVDVVDSTQFGHPLFIEQMVGGVASVVRVESTFLDDLSGGSVIFANESRRKVWSDHLLSCRSIAMADVVLCSTRQHAQFASSYNERVQILSPGIDVSELPELNSPDSYEEVCCIFVDRFDDPRKGGEIVPKLLRAFQKTTKVVVVGTARESDPIIQKMIDARPGVKLEFGPLRRSDRLDFYHKAFYFLTPTKSESFAYTALEAMACGAPVMCFNLNDAAWQTWPLWNLGMWGTDEAIMNVRRVAQEIDKQGRTKCVQDAEMIRERYSWDALVSEYISVYSKAIAQSLLSGRNRGW